MLDWNEIKNILGRHDLSRRQPAATPWEGLILGNADMGATVFGPAWKLCFRLAKMDLLDARMNVENYETPLPLSNFKEFIFAESKKLDSGQVVPIDLNRIWNGKDALYPCMRMAADLLIRVCRAEPTFPAPMEQRLRLEDGLYEADFNPSWWPGAVKIKCRAFVAWQHNVLCVRLSFPAHRSTVISLFRDPYGGRSWENLSAGPSLYGVKETDFRRDPRAGMLPPSVLKTEGNKASLWQVIPGDACCPERGFSIVAACAEKDAVFFMEPSGYASLEQLDRKELTLFVALTSEMEAGQSMKRAHELADEALREGWDAIYARHREAWKEFWTKSVMELEDAALEQQWARQSYGLAITARAGRPAPGLFGVFTPNDSPPWRGDRHNNYPEYSSRFWGAFPGNHEEQALNYPEFVYKYLPTARRIAREIFECEQGAAYPPCYIDGTELYWFHKTWARSLFLTALHAQNCWWHYQYFGDRRFLETMAYPVMRECADFYVEMLKKNPPGDWTFWPTIACEIRGWTKDFEFNRNCIEDLAFIKFLMRAVLEASEILGIDADRRLKWRDILGHLPEYPTLVVNGKEEFTDFAGQVKRPEYNHSVPLAVFWPAEDPDIYADPRLRQTGLNTLSAHSWEDITRLMIACMRLGMKEKVYEKMLAQPVSRGDDCQGGHSSGNLILIHEMLLASWDGMIRIFPCWPLEKRARFNGLRAKGAFLVDAACEDGKVKYVKIHSEQGNPIRLVPPWPMTRVYREPSGEQVEVVRKDGLIVFPTTPGASYALLPEKSRIAKKNG